MLKFLLSILLLLAGLKIVTGNVLLMFSSGIEKICLQDEEDQKDKAEKKQNKQFDDDKVPVYYPVDYSLFNPAGNQAIRLRNHKPYRSFFDQPNTPPPDIA